MQSAVLIFFKPATLYLNQIWRLPILSAINIKKLVLPRTSWVIGDTTKSWLLSTLKHLLKNFRPATHRVSDRTKKLTCLLL